jgi:hypothetical protein
MIKIVVEIYKFSQTITSFIVLGLLESQSMHIKTLISFLLSTSFESPDEEMKYNFETSRQ